MQLLAVLAVTRPWTYWIAPVLLVAVVTLVVAMAAIYYRSVLVPRARWELREEQQRLTEARGPDRPLPRSGAAEERPQRQAA